MRTTFRARQPYADIFLECAEKMPCASTVRPARFMEKMRMNQGSIGSLNSVEGHEAYAVGWKRTWEKIRYEIATPVRTEIIIDGQSRIAEPGTCVLWGAAHK